jgi:hypothetical protein
MPRPSRPPVVRPADELLTPELARAILEAVEKAARLPRAKGVHPQVTVRFRTSDVQLVTATDHTCQTFR